MHKRSDRPWYAVLILTWLAMLVTVVELVCFVLASSFWLLYAMLGSGVLVLLGLWWLQRRNERDFVQAVDEFFDAAEDL